MDPVSTPAAAAPAQPAAPTPTTQPATHAAVVSGDTSAFRAARRAERVGKPLADVPVAPPAPTPITADVTIPEGVKPEAPTAPAPTEEQRQISKRQQEINDRIRKAVADATASTNAELARLRAQIAPPAPPAPPAPAAPVAKTWTDVVKAPDIAQPMLSEAQFFEQFPDAPYAAYGRYWERYDTSMERAEAHTRAQQEHMTAAQQQRVDNFVTKLHEARAADPEFVNKLTPEVRALRPFSALTPGEQGGPLNVIAEQVYDSPIVDKVLLHLSQHPDELARLSTMPADILRLPAHQRVRAHMRWIVREFNGLEGWLSRSATAAPPTPDPKTITSLPAPAQTLGSRPHEATDPITSAVRSGSTRAYREAKRAKLAAQHGR